ncbi:MAG TPA: hypothetical protein VMU48_07370 [Terracidiphilus sp.]|nr:hypothetical protein [Terracidiphilus sp.]
MRGLLAIGLGCAFSCVLHAQVVDTTVCEILKSPQSFNGKTVRVSGTASAGLDNFVIKGTGCGQAVNAIWLSYPEGAKAKSGPAAMLQLQPAQNFGGTIAAVERSPVTLEKDKNFKQFDSLLSSPYKGGGGMCLGCARYEVSATMVGRLDGAVPGIHRDGTGKIVSIEGFGNLNAYSARLVLQSVSDVTPHEIDYSKTTASTKDDSVQDANGDPVAAAHKAAVAFGAGNLAGDTVERAAAAFGKQGEKNGVVISFGVANEASTRDEGKGSADSPDGVLFNCKFDASRLKGGAETIAITLVGTQIADIRNPGAGNAPATIYERESHAWETATLTAIGGGLKTLRAPGGYLMWNRAWQPEERQKMAEEAFRGFLANEELMTQ